MLCLYITKVIDDALKYLPSLNLNVQKRIKKNKQIDKQNQMITAELLLYYALKESGYKKEIKTDYLPKLVLLNSDLFISKSHSHKYVLVAISTSNVGCDIQKFKTVKKPEKILGAEELKNYNQALDKDKKKIFSLYWTAKESFIKYHGSLTKDYKNIIYKIEKKINDFTAGKIDNLYCYQSFFKDYSFAVITKEFIAPEVIIINNKSLLNGD